MKRFWTLLIVCSIAFGLTSCGGDDEDYNPDTTIIETENGEKLQVTGVGSNEYEYDDEGYLTYCYIDYGEYEVSDKGTTFVDEDGCTIKLSYNSKGYITKVTENGEETGSYWSALADPFYFIPVSDTLFETVSSSNFFSTFALVKSALKKGREAYLYL